MFKNLSTRLFLGVVSSAAALGLVGGLVAAAVMPPTYTASVVRYVVVNGGDSADQLAAMSTVLSDRAPSYTGLVKTSAVLDPVIKQLGLDETPAELADDVSASLGTQTLLITIEVNDEDPQKAARTAEAIGESLSAVVPRLENTNDTGMKVEMVEVQPAAVPETPNAPSALVTGGVGLVVGALIGYLIAAIIAGRARRPSAGAVRAARGTS